MNEEDRSTVQETINRVQRPKFKQNRATNGGSAPPIRFGEVNVAWSLGDSTVSVIPARFDDLGTSLSNTDAIDVYIMYHQTNSDTFARYLEDFLAVGKVIPYISFQGPDVNGVYGIAAGQFMMPNLNPFGVNYVLDGSTPSIQLNSGEVYEADEDYGTEVSNASKYPLNADKFFYVYITITAVENADPTISINSAIQATDTEQSHWTESAGTIEIKYLVGWIDGTDEEFYQIHEGDIFLDHLFTPGFDTDFQGDTINEALMAMVSDATAPANPDASFLKLNASKMRFSAGELSGYTEGTEYEFGGVNSDSFQEMVDEIDTTIENEIGFIFGEVDWDIDTGLVQSFGSPAQLPNDVIIKALAKWIGIEKGGVFKHLNSPVDSTSHDDHWFYVTITINGGISINGGTAVDEITFYFDKKGHLWKYNTEEQPPPEENWRYRHCSDSSTYPDLIFESQQADTVIRVNDECYEEVGETEEDATSPAPTVSSTFATCTLCEDSINNEQWKKCSDDSDAAILSDTHTDVDYAWLCLGGVWEKCYNDSLTGDAVNDPTVLKQCNITPTSCSDLTGWPASDDFGGSGCNTGAIGDDNYVARWGTVASEGSVSISLSALRIAVDSGNPKAYEVQINDTHSGDFTCSCYINISNFDADTGTVQVAQLKLNVGGGSTNMVIRKDTASANDKWTLQANGTDITDSWSSSAIYFRISRTGSAFKFEYSSNGTSWTDSGVSKTDSGDIRPALRMFSRWTGGMFTASYDSFVFEDGSSNDINVDPTGNSCS